jgi:putative cardiolipin synthase
VPGDDSCNRGHAGIGRRAIPAPESASQPSTTSDDVSYMPHFAPEWPRTELGAAPAKRVLPGRLGSLLALCLLVAAATLGGCASLPPGVGYPKTVSTALEHPEQTRLGRQFAAAAPLHPGLSAFRLVPTGVDGFLLRAQMIARAEQTLDLQYFIFRADETGKLLTDALLRAADRGVRVRLLIDDADNTGQDAQIEALDAHPNIEVRLYNPLAYRGNAQFLRWAEELIHRPRLDYRMHNKQMLVDNAIALVGGRNVGDDYFQVNPEGQLGDYEVFAGGPIVADLSKSFDEYWKTTSSIPVAALATGPILPQALADYRRELTLHRQEKRADGTDYATRVLSGEPLAGTLGGRLPLLWARATLFYDTPEKGRVEKGEKSGRLMRHAVLDAAAAARTEVIMISAFFVPGEDGMALFDDLHRRDVVARLLTNSIEANSEPAAAAGYMHYRRALLADEVQLYEIRALPGSVRGTGQNAIMSSYGNFGLHTKLYIFDREKIFVGSMNFDQRSLHLNTEMGLMIESPELARQGAALFEGLAQPANSYHVLLAPRAGRGLRTAASSHLVWSTLENGQLAEYTREPTRDDWQRLKINLISLLPLDGEL